MLIDSIMGIIGVLVFCVIMFVLVVLLVYVCGRSLLEKIILRLRREPVGYVITTFSCGDETGLCLRRLGSDDIKYVHNYGELVDFIRRSEHE